MKVLFKLVRTTWTQIHAKYISSLLSQMTQFSLPLFIRRAKFECNNIDQIKLFFHYLLGVCINDHISCLNTPFVLRVSSAQCVRYGCFYLTRT